MPIKKIAFFVILIASFFVINNMIHSIFALWQKDQLVVSAQKELEEEKRKNQELKKQLAVVQKSQFVEEEARNKLFLAKPGESLVILPTIQPVEKRTQNTSHDAKANWQQWWEFFTKTQ